MQTNKVINTQRYESDPLQAAWVYKTGAVAAVIAVLVAVLEIVITFLPVGTSVETVTVYDWFALFEASWFMGLRNLGLINIIIQAMAIPTFFSLYAAHRRTQPAAAALAVLVAWIGVAVFFATNRAFPMLALSREYAAASTNAQRIVAAAAGQAMLSVGQSHTQGTFFGFALSEIGGIMISIVMLRAAVFSKPAAWAGLLGFGALFPFEIVASFQIIPFESTIPLAMIGGLFSMAWYILIARRLWELGRNA